MGRADMAVRVPKTLEQLGHLEAAGLWRAPDAVASLLDAARALPPPEATVVAHGDLHIRHLVVDTGGALSGVIDWGDVCRGDPSIDLSLLWSSARRPAAPTSSPRTARSRDDQLVRARVLAINLCVGPRALRPPRGDGRVEQEARAGLDRAAAL